MTTSKPRRGLAARPPEQRRAIASQGGRMVQRKGTAHHFTPAEAREAGRKGGQTVSRDRAHMAEIGRKGRQARDRQLQAGGRDRPGEEAG